MYAPRSAPAVDPRFLVRDFEPAYLRLYRSGALSARVEAALQELEDCCACPRNCHINRLRNETRLCHTGRHAIVSSAFPHFGEEDCLRGWNGSGTIFFGLCNLRCVFCQNWDISWGSLRGVHAPPERLATMMLELQGLGCHNVNFVTPEHVVPQVLEALPLAIGGGLRLPLVYNTSAYTASKACGCSTASSTSTCRTSSSGRARHRGATCGGPTTPTSPARRSARCTARSATW